MVDRSVGDGLGEVALAGSARTDQDQVLSPADPVEAAQSPLGIERDGRRRRIPGLERLARRQAGGLAMVLAGRMVAADGVLGEEGHQDPHVVPAFGCGLLEDRWAGPAA